MSHTSITVRRWQVLCFLLLVLLIGHVIWHFVYVGRLKVQIRDLEAQQKALKQNADLPGEYENRYEVIVVSKQWMWKFQHPEDQREHSELHVPVGRPIQFLLTSEDVIHRLDIPEIQFQAEAAPGKYTTAWAFFSKPGRYTIQCGQPCGAHHVNHTGTVIALEPTEFEAWKEGILPSAKKVVDGQTAMMGRNLFLKLQCVNCHHAGTDAKGPRLDGIVRTQAKLKDGTAIVRETDYLRESIRKPQAKIVEGWKPIMPEYSGDKLSDDELSALITYLMSMKPGEAPTKVEKPSPAPVGQPRLEPLQPKN